MHYYKFNIGDYASHTSHLDPLEDIAYRRMLDWHYLHESALPESVEQIARLIRMRSHCEEIANVLREFFTLGEFGYFQVKAMKEIEAYNLKSEKAKASAEARWAKKPMEPYANALRPECEGNANHKPLTNNHKPLTNNQEQPKEKAEQSSTVVSEVFTYWQEVMNHPRSKLDPKRKKLISSALKLGYTVDELKSAISGCAKTPFNMGINDKSQKYDDIGLILRDAGHIDKYMANDQVPPVQQQAQHKLTGIDAVRARRNAGQLNIINQNEVIGHE